MSSPDSGEYSARSLAEILREHGLETELGTRPGRRRRTSDDPDVTGRSPRVEPAARAPRPPASVQAPAQSSAPRSSAPARTRSPAPAGGRALAATPSPARASAPVWTGQPEPGPRPAAGLAGPAAPVREAVAAPAWAEPAAREVPAERGAPTGRSSVAGPAGPRGDGAPPPTRHGRRKGDSGPVARVSGPSTSAIPALGAARTGADHPVTGPIPVQTGARAALPQDAEPLTGRQSVLAWIRFAGELVVALAVGIGLYFAFTVLWELMPYVALVAAPLTVTALVAGVAAWRQRQGQGQLGVRLLAVLLLAGTVLVIAPAAGLLAD
jgi:hypothetical protein